VVPLVSAVKANTWEIDKILTHAALDALEESEHLAIRKEESRRARGKGTSWTRSSTPSSGAAPPTPQAGGP
jgi:hypothetical protein